LRIAPALIRFGISADSRGAAGLLPAFPCRVSVGARLARKPAIVHAPPAIMTISLNDVYRIAHLARVEIDQAHAEEVRAELAAIFGLIDELASVDTAGVVPMAHAQDVTLPLRADAAVEPDLRTRYQSLAPAVEDGLYLVPRVLD
jgi:aspartyl-tRNA(Asn)/glutamyl-tRNA(Gln) amidotransferase subunit C